VKRLLLGLVSLGLFGWMAWLLLSEADVSSATCQSPAKVAFVNDNAGLESPPLSSDGAACDRVRAGRGMLMMVAAVPAIVLGVAAVSPVRRRADS
jgi:hypothetical protein